MKISAKTTKNDLVKVLRTNFKTVEAMDKNLADRVIYTVKNKPTRKDLVDIVKEVMTTLGDKFVEPAEEAPKPEKPTKVKAENSVKKPTKVEKNTEAETPAEEEKPKKTKKSAKKADGVTVLEEKTVPLASVFPESIEVDGETYVIAHEVKTIKDLLDGEFEFAFYWSKRLLRQFPYFSCYLGQPKSFPNDLDTAQLIYVSDMGKVAYCISDSTEAPYTILPNELEEVEGIRFCSGIEYQIYKKEDTATEE